MRALVLGSTLLASSVPAMEVAVEANPLLYALNTQPQLTSINLASNLRFNGGWSLASTYHYYHDRATGFDEDWSIENNAANLTLRYALGKGLYVGGAYRMIQNRNEGPDESYRRLRQGLGFTLGQEITFGDHWYLGHSLTLGRYLYNETEVLYSDGDDTASGNWVTETISAAGASAGYLFESTLLNIQLVQVGYRF